MQTSIIPTTLTTEVQTANKMYHPQITPPSQSHSSKSSNFINNQKTISISPSFQIGATINSHSNLNHLNNLPTLNQMNLNHLPAKMQNVPSNLGSSDLAHPPNNQDFSRLVSNTNAKNLHNLIQSDSKILLPQTNSISAVDTGGFRYFF